MITSQTPLEMETSELWLKTIIRHRVKGRNEQGC